MAKRKTNPTARRKLIGAVKCIVRDRPGLSGEENRDVYEDFLEGVTGKRSCKDMSIPELKKVLKALDGTASKAAKKFTPSAKPLVRKLHKLWSALGEMGAVESATPEALAAWVKGRTKTLSRPDGVESPEWLTNAEAHSLVEQLKAWVERVDLEQVMGLTEEPEEACSRG